MPKVTSSPGASVETVPTVRFGAGPVSPFAYPDDGDSDGMGCCDAIVVVVSAVTLNANAAWARRTPPESTHGVAFQYQASPAVPVCPSVATSSSGAPSSHAPSPVAGCTSPSAPTYPI